MFKHKLLAELIIYLLMHYIKFSLEHIHFLISWKLVTVLEMAWCFEDEITQYSEFVFDSLQTSSALVPTIWPLEVANVLLIAERKKRLTSLKSVGFKEALTSLPIEIDHSATKRAMGSIIELAKEVNLTVYDAAYLDLAIHNALPLATLDADLKKAAIKVGVDLY